MGCRSQSIFRIAQKHHLLPFDLAERVVLDDDDLDVSLYFTQVANSPMSMVKPPSPTKATTCRSGIGDRGGDGVGQAAGHGGESAGEREHHVAADLRWRATRW